MISQEVPKVWAARLDTELQTATHVGGDLAAQLQCNDSNELFDINFDIPLVDFFLSRGAHACTYHSKKYSYSSVFQAQLFIVAL